jgi:hypothetical protein
MKQIMTMRTHLANEFAAAGAALLDFTRTAGALAAIPHTTPQQYAVAGTLESISAVLPAAAPSHPQRRQRHGDRPTEPLSFEDDAAPAAPAVTVSPAPRVELPDGWTAMRHDNAAGKRYIIECVRSIRSISEDDEPTMFRFFEALTAHLARQAQPTDRDAVLEEAARCAEVQNRVGYEWVKDSVWDNIIKRVPAAIRALKGKSGSEGAADAAT